MLKKIILIAVVATPLSVNASEKTWSEIWGDVKSTSSQVWHKTESSTRNVINTTVEKTNTAFNNTVKGVKETELNIAIPTNDSDGTLLEKFKGGISKTKSYIFGKNNNEVPVSNSGEDFDSIEMAIKSEEEEMSRLNKLTDEELFYNPNDNIKVIKVREVYN